MRPTCVRMIISFHFTIFKRLLVYVTASITSRPDLPTWIYFINHFRMVPLIDLLEGITISSFDAERRDGSFTTYPVRGEEYRQIQGGVHLDRFCWEFISEDDPLIVFWVMTFETAATPLHNSQPLTLCLSDAFGSASIL